MARIVNRHASHDAFIHLPLETHYEKVYVIIPVYLSPWQCAHSLCIQAYFTSFSCIQSCSGGIPGTTGRQSGAVQ